MAPRIIIELRNILLSTEVEKRYAVIINKIPIAPQKLPLKALRGEDNILMDRISKNVENKFNKFDMNIISFFLLSGTYLTFFVIWQSLQRC